MKAIVTVTGKDQVGIIAAVCTRLSERNVNVLDISQTTLQENYFTMTLLVDVEAATVPFAQLKEELAAAGTERGLVISAQREDTFLAMHRL